MAELAIGSPKETGRMTYIVYHHRSSFTVHRSSLIVHRHRSSPSRSLSFGPEDATEISVELDF